MRGGFRQDIQGLRAVAVVIVALDHANVGPLTGGFVGVDLFFVISGFLITGLLLREAGTSGTVSLSDFYARRARRILPAAFAVILVTIVASALLLDGARALRVGEEAVWATLFAANIKFAQAGTDYFAAGDPPSPLQHYWSLSVEEQFYLVWPLLVLAVVAVARRRGWRLRATALAALVPVTAASYLYGLHVTAADPVSAYFSSPARAWELACGAATAVALPLLVRLPGALLAAGAWLGVGLVGYAALTYSAQTVFPGAAAVAPVLGAVLLLAATPDRSARWAPHRLLSVAPLRLIGDWSYSLYLWHWPLIILAGYHWGGVAGWRGLAVLAAAVVLAGLTYRWVETPFRRSGVLSRSRVRGLLMYPAMLGLVLPAVAVAHQVVQVGLAGGGAAISADHYGRAPGDPAVDFSNDPYVALVQASVHAAENDLEIPAELQPHPLELRSSVASLGDCPYVRIPTDGLRLCPRGDLDGERVMVLLGDSHMRQWIPALEPLATSLGYRVHLLIREGCPAFDRTPWRSNDTGPNVECAEFQDWAAGQVAELRPAVTIMSSDVNTAGLLDDEGRRVRDADQVAELVESGMTAQLARIQPHSGRTIVLEDPPIHVTSPIDCLTKPEPTLRGCLSPPRQRSLTMAAATRRATVAAGAEFVHTAQWFCVGRRCPTVVGRMVTHRDVEHVTTVYAAYLAPALADVLRLTDARDAR